MQSSGYSGAPKYVTFDSIAITAAQITMILRIQLYLLHSFSQSRFQSSPNLIKIPDPTCEKENFPLNPLKIRKQEARPCFR